MVVSILVPIYNVAPYIERCARSLFEQTYKDIEFIFVNDATPDNSIDILNRVMKEYPGFSEKSVIINHDSNMGVASARNTAVSTATGEYILHVDSDDWIEKDAVELMLNVATKHDADIVYSDFVEVRTTGTNILVNPNINDPSQYTKSLLKRKSLTHIIGKLIRRSVIIDNNLSAVDGINQGEDYLLIPKIAYHSDKVAKVDKPIYNYNRLNVNSYTANVGETGIDNYIKVQSLLVEFFSKIPDADKYNDTIEQSCIFNKLTCFYSGPLSSYKKISSLYKDINWRKMDLKMKQRLILALSDFNMLRTVHYLISIANRNKR